MIKTLSTNFNKKKIKQMVLFICDTKGVGLQYIMSK